MRRFPPFAYLTSDVAIFSSIHGTDHVLLVRRGRPPYKGRWALPGGFAEPQEKTETTARREVFEETGLRPRDLKRIGVYANPGRDPRGRVATFVYAARVDARRVRPRAGDDAASVGWFPVKRLPRMAFDHADVVRDAFAVLRGKR